MVGVSADALNLRKKGREPVFSEGERLAIVAALKPVDEVFLEESLELKRDYIVRFGADVLVMGDDWAGRFDEFPRRLRGRLPPPYPGDLHDRTDREDLRHLLRRPARRVCPALDTGQADRARSPT